MIGLHPQVIAGSPGELVYVGNSRTLAQVGDLMVIVQTASVSGTTAPIALISGFTSLCLLSNTANRSSSDGTINYATVTVRISYVIVRSSDLSVSIPGLVRTFIFRQEKPTRPGTAFNVASPLSNYAIAGLKGAVGLAMGAAVGGTTTSPGASTCNGVGPNQTDAGAVSRTPAGSTGVGVAYVAWRASFWTGNLKPGPISATRTGTTGEFAVTHAA